MASSSLLPSKYFDKLQVNRLEAQAIRSDNISGQSPSYLFSAVFNNVIFERNQTGGILIITKSDTESIIQFTDRPFRQTAYIDFETFINLFDSSGIDSFEEDPPNGVLTHTEEQKTYKITLLSRDLETATFNLELLPDETHNLGIIKSNMNLFFDNNSNTSASNNTLPYNIYNKSFITPGTYINKLIQGKISYANLSTYNFFKKYFGGKDLTNTNFSDCYLYQANFSQTSGSNLTMLESTNFKGAVLAYANFANTSITNIILDKYTVLEGVNFTNVGVANWGADGLNDLSGYKFRKSIFKKAVFQGVNLKDADFTNSRFESAGFYDNKISDNEISDFDISDVEMSDNEISNNKIIKNNFTNTNFSSCNFDSAYLSDQDLSSVQTLIGCRFEYAKLKNTKFNNLNLSHCRFQNATLTDANLSNAILYATVFDGANLEGADFTNCKIDSGTSFKNVTINNNTKLTSEIKTLIDN